MSAQGKQLIQSAETRTRRGANQLSKYGTLDADDIVNLLDDARYYCGLKGIDFDECWQRIGQAWLVHERELSKRNGHKRAGRPRKSK